MNENQHETEAEELARYLERAAEAGKKVIEDFKTDEAKRDHYKIMEDLHQRMWRNGEAG